MAQYSKAIAAAIPVALAILNQLLPITSGNTKTYVNVALLVLTVLSVYYSPKNADAPAKSALVSPKA